MKKISSVISLSFLVLFLIVTPVIGSSDWVEYGRTSDGTVMLYDKKNITKSGGKGIVQVWMKWIYSDKPREKFIKKARNSGLSTEGWDKLLYGIILYQIDCKKKKSRLFSVIQYDEGGNVLHNDHVDEPKWDYIVPDSSHDNLQKIVCK